MDIDSQVSLFVEMIYQRS